MKYHVSIMRMLCRRDDEYESFSYFIMAKNSWCARTYPAGELWVVELNEEDLVYIRLKFGDRGYKRLREISK